MGGVDNALQILPPGPVLPQIHQSKCNLKFYIISKANQKENKKMLVFEISQINPIRNLSYINSMDGSQSDTISVQADSTGKWNLTKMKLLNTLFSSDILTSYYLQSQSTIKQQNLGSVCKHFYYWRRKMLWIRTMRPGSREEGATSVVFVCPA